MTSTDDLPLEIIYYNTSEINQRYVANKNVSVEYDDEEPYFQVTINETSRPKNSKTPGVIFKNLQLHPHVEYRLSVSGYDDLNGRLLLYAGCIEHNVVYKKQSCELLGDEFITMDFVATRSLTDVGVLVRQAVKNDSFKLLQIKLEKLSNADPADVYPALYSNYITIDTEQKILEDKTFICQLDTVGQFNINSSDFPLVNKVVNINRDENCGNINIGCDNGDNDLNIYCHMENFDNTEAHTAEDEEEEELSLYGSFVMEGGLNIRKNCIINSTTNASDISSTYNTHAALVITGGTAVGKNLRVGNNLYVSSDGTIMGTTQSTNLTTGALIVDGGTAIKKNLHVGHNLYVSTDVTIMGTTQSTNAVTGSLIVGGGVGIMGRLNVSDNISTLSSLYASSIYQNGYLLVPPGVIMPYSAAAAPSGYLLCDGSAISRTTYADLYSIIGILYGSGNGTTTFNVPNLSDRFILTKGSIYTSLGTTGGSSTKTLSTSEMPAHTHDGTTLANGTHTHTGTVSRLVDRSESETAQSGSGVVVSGSDPELLTLNITNAGDHNHTFTTNSTGGGASFSIMNPYIVLNYIIKY